MVRCEVKRIGSQVLFNLSEGKVDGGQYCDPQIDMT